MLTKLLGYYKTSPAMKKMYPTSVLGTLLVTMSAFGIPTAYAGPGSSGGGGGIACVDDVFAAGTKYRNFFKDSYNPKGEQKYVYVLDYFQSKIPTVDGLTQPNLFDGGASKMSESAAFAKLKAQFELIWEAKGNFNGIQNGIGPIESWVDSPLQDSNDSGRMYRLPKGCKYVQLAYRQNDVVYGDSAWIKKLNGVQRAILRMHEIFYAAYLKDEALTSGVTRVTSVPIRDLLKTLLLRASPDSVAYSDRIESLMGQLISNFKVLGPISYYGDTQRRFSVHHTALAIYGTTLNPSDICGSAEEDADIREIMSEGPPKSFGSGPATPDPEHCEKNGYIFRSNWRLAFNRVMATVHYQLTALRDPERHEVTFTKDKAGVAKYFVNWLEANRKSAKSLPGYDSAVYEGALYLAKELASK